MSRKGYRVFYWRKMEPGEEPSGWKVAEVYSGHPGKTISTHGTAEEADAAARRYRETVFSSKPESEEQSLDENRTPESLSH